MKATIRTGDWVCFYRNGAIVYGKVEYIRDDTNPAYEICTTAGCVYFNSILEIRRDAINDFEESQQ